MNRLNTLSDAVATHARLSPQKLAVRDSRRSLTFAQWHERTEQLTQGLHALGLRKGDRVALLAYNCLEWMEMYAALARAGLVAVPLNFRLTAPEIAYIAEHSEARAFIVQDVLASVVEPLRQTLGLEPGGQHVQALAEGIGARSDEIAANISGVAEAAETTTQALAQTQLVVQELARTAADGTKLSGDLVVTAGQLKLRDGVAVKVAQPTAPPAAAPAAAPATAPASTPKG